MKFVECLFALGLYFVFAIFAQADEVAILELHHRSADELVPILKPLIEPGGAISSSGNQLIVRASAATLAHLRQTLSDFDRPLRQVQISVRRASQQTIERDAAKAKVQVRDGITIRNYATDNATQSQETGVTRVIVQEGKEAFVQASQSMATLNVAGMEYSSRSGSYAPVLGVEHRELQSGTWIVPRLVDQRVQLEVIQQRQAPSADGSVATQRVSTTVSGDLGAWLPLSGVGLSEHSTTVGVTEYSTRTQDDDLTWWIKVEELAPP